MILYEFGGSFRWRLSIGTYETRDFDTLQEINEWLIRNQLVVSNINIKKINLQPKNDRHIDEVENTTYEQLE